ncbi:MAG: hypothetical protein HYZ28_20895 [Myxococcales bacterium]|nr:hypothetical protein [Myxococcales bacterium]
MPYPPRLAHLATKAVVVAKLAPTHAQAHSLDDDEAIDRLGRALSGPLLERLLLATWDALKATAKRLDEAGLLEKVAASLKERPQRPGRVAKLTPALSAFLVLLDVEAGTATDAARRVLERDEGRRMVEAGLAEAGVLLAKELTR